MSTLTPPTVTPPAAAPVTTPVAEPAWHEGIISKGSDGKEILADYATWKDKAPEPLRKFINDNMTAARAKIDGMLKVPGADDPPEAWEPVWKALGRPDAPEGYGLAKPEALPPGVEWNDEFAAGFAKFAHSAGMPKAHAEKLIAWHTEQMGQQAAGMKTAGEKLVADERKQLTETFGVGLPEAAARAQAAAVEEGLSPALFDPAAGDFLGAPALKVVAALTEKLAKYEKEGSFGGGGGSSPATGGYEYAKAASTDKEHPDYAKYHGNDPEVVRRVNEGWKQAPKTRAA